MKNKVIALAQARLDYLNAQDARQKALDAFWSKPENSALTVAEREAKEAWQKADDELRQASLDQYERDGEKKCEGYEIKLVKVVEIKDPQKAFAWCLSNFTPALKLDTRMFEKAVKDGTIPTELAKVKDEPKVYVDKDLGLFLRK